MKIQGQLLTLAQAVESLAVSVLQIHHSFPLPLRNVHQFPLPTYLQDVAVGSRGDLYMTTVFPDGSIYSVSGATNTTPTINHVQKFDNVNAATGIVEIKPRVFNFLAGRQSDLGVGIHGTFGVFELDTRTGKPNITELVHVPDSGLIIGVIPVPNLPHILLVSDSTLGRIWRIDTATRKYEPVLGDRTMKPPPWGVLPFGIGGIQLHKGYLYFVACFEARIYRIRFTDDGYPAAGAEVELVVALRSIYIDNFVIGPGEYDVIWAATNADNRLFAITLDGIITVVAGAPDELTVAGVVAGSFGTLPGDANTLYVVTSGGMLNPINGTIFEGGKIVAVDTTNFLKANKRKLSLSSDHSPPDSAKTPATNQSSSTKARFDGSVSKCIVEIIAVSFRYIVGR
ncbi:MAG: hypothetical protein Q9209_003861 [Squamulea sp. 1 TL-2023]